MNRLYTFFAAIMVAFSLSGCRDMGDDLPLPFAGNNGYSMLLYDYLDSNEKTLEHLWKSMTTSYVLWDLETQDWDAKYHAFAPIFRQWDEKAAKETLDADEVQKTLNDLFCDFQDGHMTVDIDMWMGTDEDGNAIFEHFIVIPLDIRNQKRPDFNDCYNWYESRLEILKILEEQGRFEGQLAINDDDYTVLAGGVIDGCIPYLFFNGFELSNHMDAEQLAKLNIEDAKQLYEQEELSDLEYVWCYWFQNVQLLHDKGLLKGVILDMRDNYGGYNNNFKYAIGALLDGEDVMLGHIRKKAGLGKYDYLPVTEIKYGNLQAPHAVITDVPIVTLINANTASMAEITAYATKLQPNGVVMGKRSAGATCRISNIFISTYAGTFGNLQELGYQVYTATVRFFPIDGSVLEGVGVVPDIEVSAGFTKDDDIHAFEIGDYSIITDQQLMKAIEHIHAH